MARTTTSVVKDSGVISSAHDDPEQLASEIGMFMSRLTPDERAHVQQELYEIGDGYDQNIRSELQDLRNSIVHGLQFDIFSSAHHVEHQVPDTGTGTTSPRKKTVNTVRVTTGVNSVRITKGANSVSFPTYEDRIGINTGSKCMPRPPANADKLLYLLPKNMRDAILGDLEEDFAVVANKFGRQYARRWYWWHLSMSIVYSICRKVSRFKKFWKFIGGS